MYPSIGSKITNGQAFELCQRYGLIDEAQRLWANDKQYRPWYFDGVSGIPDHLMNIFGDGFRITYQCALPHDLAYAYGQVGNSQARRLADRTFRENLINLASVAPWKAYIFWSIVRLLGSRHFGLSFSWAFADRTARHYTNGPLKISF